MTDTDRMLEHIDRFLAEHGDWLPATTVDFALDLRLMVVEAARHRLEVAA